MTSCCKVFILCSGQHWKSLYYWWFEEFPSQLLCNNFLFINIVRLCSKRSTVPVRTSSFISAFIDLQSESSSSSASLLNTSIYSSTTFFFRWLIQTTVFSSMGPTRFLCQGCPIGPAHVFEMTDMWIESITEKHLQTTEFSSMGPTTFHVRAVLLALHMGVR